MSARPKNDPSSSNYSRSTIHYPLLRTALLRWYRRNRRDLPWRETRDPYKIWVSEIMLQQTRVAAVLDYYGRFLQRFADVKTLARAREAEVLAAWSGLGYYRRARNLHRAARVIAGKKRGTFPQTVFPKTAAELRELPGIGRYTAAAIASIAFGERCAVVDGNVERVLGRISGRRLSAKKTWEMAEALVSPRAPGNFNQAMMELGATVCLPGEPMCGKCPVKRWCEHHQVSRDGGGDGRPSAIANRPQAVRKKKLAVFLLNVSGDHVLMVRRSGNQSLMPGMWELPHISKTGKRGPLEPLLRLRHSITVTDYEVHVLRSNARPRRTKWVPLAQAARLPLTGLTRKILRRAAVM
jgi:A/G-specific adenine glycosylase